MTGAASSKKNGCTEVGARVITKTSHITCMSECSRRYASTCKTKLLIGIVCKITGDKVPSGHLPINVYARFDLEGSVSKLSKVNLRSYSLALGPVLTSDFIYPHVVPPYVDTAYNSYGREMVANFILTTTNDENLQEVEAEEVKTTIETPRNTTHNPNIRNDIDCHGVRWMENNSEAKEDQNCPIPKGTWGLQTITGEDLVKGCEFGKRMSRLNFFLLMFHSVELTQCTLLTNIALRRDHINETTPGEVL